MQYTEEIRWDIRLEGEVLLERTRPHEELHFFIPLDPPYANYSELSTTVYVWERIGAHDYRRFTGWESVIKSAIQHFPEAIDTPYAFELVNSYEGNGVVSVVRYWASCRTIAICEERKWFDGVSAYEVSMHVFCSFEETKKYHDGRQPEICKANSVFLVWALLLDW